MNTVVRIQTFHGIVTLDAQMWNYLKNTYRLQTKKKTENYIVVLAVESTTGHRIKLSRLLTNCPRNRVVDHIDNDPLNNRVCNLRVCTISENRMNSRSFKSSTGFKGVYFDSTRSKPYYVNISMNNKSKHIGRYKTKTEAARAYNEAAIRYYGEYANLNKVDS